MAQQFQCPECEYRATTKSNLARHQKSVRRVFIPGNLEKQLGNHQKSVHIDQNFLCPECE